MVEFSCTTDTSPGMAVVHAAGEIDLASADRLWEAILAQLTPGTRVVLDCAGVTFCDSIGLRTLIRAYHHATATGADFALTNVEGTMERLLTLAGMAGQFPVVGQPVTNQHA